MLTRSAVWLAFDPQGGNFEEIGRMIGPDYQIDLNKLTSVVVTARRYWLSTYRHHQ
jgi:hypothetical protein